MILKIPDSLMLRAKLREDWVKYSNDLVNASKLRKVNPYFKKDVHRVICTKLRTPRLRRAIIFYYQILPLSNNREFKKEEFYHILQKEIGYSKSAICNYKKLLIKYKILKEDKYKYRLRSYDYLWSLCGIYSAKKGKKLFVYRTENGKYVKKHSVAILRLSSDFRTRKEFIKELSNVLTIKEFSRQTKKAKTDRRRRTYANTTSLTLTSKFYTQMLGFKAVNSGYLYRLSLEKDKMIKIRKNKYRITSIAMTYKTAKEKFDDLGHWSEKYEGYLKYMSGHVYSINAYDISHSYGLGEENIPPFQIKQFRYTKENLAKLGVDETMFKNLSKRDLKNIVTDTLDPEYFFDSKLDLSKKTESSSKFFPRQTTNN